MKDNVTVTSSIFSQNDGTIRISTHFLAKNHSKLLIEDINLIQYVASMLLHLTCAFEVITLPNERVIALFYHFFLQFRHIIEIDQQAHNTTTSRPPVPCILQILTTFNLYSGRPRVSTSPPPPPPPLTRCVSQNGLTTGRLNRSKICLTIWK